MEVPGHALYKMMGRTATCECGNKSEVTVKQAMAVVQDKLWDLVMDAHREHLKRVLRGKRD